jgi:hypothetical protein
MGWIFALPWEHRDEFWVNILAGIPYLFFDLVIITMLLPVTIQWWEERRWRDTRVAAMNRVLEAYRLFTIRFTDPIRSLAEKMAADPDRAAGWDKELLELADELEHRHLLAQGNTERELQTALSVLGPVYSKVILDFHYSWAKWAVYDPPHLWQALRREIERRTDPPIDLFPGRPLAGYAAYFSHSYKVHFRLRCLSLTYLHEPKTGGSVPSERTITDFAREMELDDNRLMTAWDIVVLGASGKLSADLNSYLEKEAKERRAWLWGLAEDEVLRPVVMQTLARRLRKTNIVRFKFWEQPNWTDHYKPIHIRAVKDSTA